MQTDYTGITSDLLREVALSLDNEIPSGAEVHTLHVETNGQHGGVDVEVGMALPHDDNYTKKWQVN